MKISTPPLSLTEEIDSKCINHYDLINIYIASHMATAEWGSQQIITVRLELYRLCYCTQSKAIKCRKRQTVWYPPVDWRRPQDSMDRLHWHARTWPHQLVGWHSPHTWRPGNQPGQEPALPTSTPTVVSSTKTEGPMQPTKRVLLEHISLVTGKECGIASHRLFSA